ncbi:hypothetical protein COCON_G00101780 [Conger conger]|uniref:Cytoplasmic tRNA 2-thiolation protein 2 n=1 Tax=Conger conger TaxID=82655 RepID=A0A9Q1HZ35_CONCO|nr:hypothetical protein COCON_G00101780 [Conger conger]
MCQVDEEYSEQLEKRTVPSVSQNCVKCKDGSAVLIIRAGDAFCRCCFKEYFVHKFRAMLGKNRVIFPGEKVLLAVSGGPASSAMLSQVQEGLSRDAPKKLRFIPGILHIDEGGACGQSLEERERSTAQLEAIFRATGYPFHTVPLEQVFELPSSVLEAAASAPQRPDGSYKAAVDQFLQSAKARGSSSPGEGGPDGDPAVREAQVRLSRLETRDAPNGPARLGLGRSEDLGRLLSSVRTLTAKEDMLQTLRHHLMVHTARTHGYSKVMMGDSCSRLAVKLLSNIAQGRGATLATDTGFSDPRYGDVVIIRPMRDYSSKEIAFYNKMFGVPSVFVPGLDTKASDKASIPLLTESFVTKLQTDFPPPSAPSTGPVRSYARSTLKQKKPLPSTPRWCLRGCLRSGSLGRPGRPSAGGAAPRGPAGRGLWSRRGHLLLLPHVSLGCGAPAPPDLRSLLCYSCRLTVKDMSAVDTLPPYIVSEAEHRSHRLRMKQEISEFLLDEEEEDDDDEEAA